MKPEITLYKTSNPDHEGEPSSLQVGSFRDESGQKWYALYLFGIDGKPNETLRSVYLYEIMNTLAMKEGLRNLPKHIRPLISMKGGHDAQRKFLSDPRLETEKQVTADTEFLRKMTGQDKDDKEDEDGSPEDALIGALKGILG